MPGKSSDSSCSCTAVSIQRWALYKSLALISQREVCLFFCFNLATSDLLQPLPYCYWWLCSIAECSHRTDDRSKFFKHVHVHRVYIHTYAHGVHREKDWHNYSSMVTVSDAFMQNTSPRPECRIGPPHTLCRRGHACRLLREYA